MYNNKGVLFKIYKANISYKDVTEMNEIEKDQFLASDSYFKTEESHLCQIKVTLLNDDSFTLGVSVNHTLQDAHGCFWFMNAWSHKFENLNNKNSGFGQYTNGDISERVLFTGKGVEPATSSPIYKVEDSLSHWFVSYTLCSVDFHVSKNKLKYWKEMFQEIRGKDVDPLFISSNDVLTAILFKAVTQSKKMNNNETVKLGVSVNHTLQDGHGCFWFMNAWSHKFENLNNEDGGFGQYTNGDISERVLFTGNGVEPATSSPVYKVEGSLSHWFVSGGLCSADFHVSKNKLKYWKEMFQEIREKHVDPLFISSNDVLAAIFFKAVIQSKNLNKSETVKLAMVVNIRERFGLTDNYTGNATIGIGIVTTVEKLSKMNICELASLIRKELIALDKFKIQATLSYLETALNWKDAQVSLDLKKDLCFVSWESFPIFKPKFGLGEPKDFICPWGIHGVPIVKPLPSKDFVSVNLSLTNEQMECVYNDENVRYITQKS